MYAALWRILPGGTGVKLACSVGLFLVMLLLLWYVIFPWLEPKIHFDHGTVDGPSAVPTTAR